MSLGELIKNKGLTNYKVAKKAGIGQSTIHEIVNGNRKEIRLSTAKKIADVLDVTTEKIYECIGGGGE